MAPITSSIKLAETAWYLATFNDFLLEDFFISVVCTRNVFTECVVSKLFIAFTNICFKELDALPKLIILETYNYSPRYIL